MHHAASKRKYGDDPLTTFRPQLSKVMKPSFTLTAKSEKQFNQFAEMKLSALSVNESGDETRAKKHCGWRSLFTG
jgi:hypothetical protein